MQDKKNSFRKKKKIFVYKYWIVKDNALTNMRHAQK